MKYKHKLYTHTCQECDKTFECYKYDQKYCSMSCSSVYRWKLVKETGKNTFNTTGPTSTISFNALSKNKKSIWGNARKVYKVKNPNLSCAHCGINDEEIIDICHIKAISEFSKDTLILEVNQISNLIALCKNCHWKFDKHLPGKKGNKKVLEIAA